MGLVLKTPYPDYYPTQLGAALYGLYDAENTASLTLSGSNVTTWTDPITGFAPTQTTSGFKPILGSNPTTGRPEVQFDGTDDYLSAATHPYPIGSSPSMVIVLCRQASLVADTTVRRVVCMGGPSTVNQARRLNRQVISGVNRAGITPGIGTAVTDTSVDFSGNHIVWGQFGPVSSVAVDGGSATTTSTTTATTNSFFRIGASEATTPTGNLLGGVMMALVVDYTSSTFTTQFPQLLALLKTRGGIP